PARARGPAGRVPRNPGAARRRGIHARRNRAPHRHRAGHLEEPALARASAVSPPMAARFRENVMTDDDVAKALADARQDEAPPADSERQILAALQATGLVRRPRRPFRTGLLIAASMAASLVVGVWIGMGYRRPSPDQTRFLLLLYEDANFD